MNRRVDVSEFRPLGFAEDALQTARSRYATRAALSATLAFLLGNGPCRRCSRRAPHTLGEVEGVRLTFKDACARGGRVFVTAAAEASPNAIDDGVVVGCALGVWDGARWDL